MKKVKYLLLGLMVSGLVAGCGAKNSAESVPASEQPPSQTVAAETNAPSEAAEDKGEAAEVGTVPADYPAAQTITFIVNRAAGGAVDTVARAVATDIQSEKGYTTVVQNLDGGDGLIGANEGINAKPDGYTFLVLGSTEIPNLLVNFEEAQFTAEDMVPVCQLTSKSKILVLKPNSQFASLDEFVAYAKEHPGELTIAIPGSNTAYGPKLIEEALGIELTVINAGSGNAAYTMALGGHVDCAEIGAQFFENAKAENMFVLGDTGERMDHTEDGADTFKSQGYDLVDTNFNYILAPKGTPEPIVKAMSDLIGQLINEGEMGTALLNTKQGLDYKGYEEFSDAFEANLERMIAIYSTIDLAE